MPRLRSTVCASTVTDSGAPALKSPVFCAGDVLRQRVTGGLPGLQSTVEQRNRVMAEPAQQPPCARGVHAALRVISDHLLTLLKPARLQRLHQPRAIRQRMAAIVAGLRPGQIAIEVQIMRAWQMPGQIGFLARLGVGQIETAIDDEHAARRGG